MPLCAIRAYLVEKNNQSIYKENCMYLTAVVNMDKNSKHLLKQPYLYNSERKRKQAQSEIKTEHEAYEYVFDGV